MATPPRMTVDGLMRHYSTLRRKCIEQQTTKPDRAFCPWLRCPAMCPTIAQTGAFHRRLTLVGSNAEIFQKPRMMSRECASTPWICMARKRASKTMTLSVSAPGFHAWDAEKRPLIRCLRGYLCCQGAVCA